MNHKTVVGPVYPTNDSSVPALEEFGLVEKTDSQVKNVKYSPAAPPVLSL